MEFGKHSHPRHHHLIQHWGRAWLGRGLGGEGEGREEWGRLKVVRDEGREGESSAMQSLWPCLIQAGFPSRTLGYSFLFFQPNFITFSSDTRLVWT
jgi:hypothetical protein